MKRYKYNNETKLYDIPLNETVELNPLNKSGEKPAEYSIVIRCEPKKEQTQGGIYLPDSAADKEMAKTTYGVIVDIGAKAFEDFPEKPEIGDIVTFKPFRAHDVVFGGEGVQPGEYRMISDKHILSVKLNMKKEELKWWK